MLKCSYITGCHGIQLNRYLRRPEAREKVFIEIHEDGEVIMGIRFANGKPGRSGSTFKIKRFAQVIVLPQAIAAKPHWTEPSRGLQDAWAFGHREGAE